MRIVIKYNDNHYHKLKAENFVVVVMSKCLHLT